MATGPRDTGSLVMLTGWDATELQKFKLKEGITYGEIVGLLNTGLAAVNAELYNDPLWSGLVSYQDELEVEYRMGTSTGMSLHSEYSRPDPQKGETEGHMLPFQKWDGFSTWTYDYLLEAKMSQIEADIAEKLKDIRDKWRVQVLTRLLKRGDDSGQSKGLGSTGYSPGFATTAASTNVDFTPPSYGGTSFSNTHEHYVGIAGGAFTAAVFTDAKDELREHGHEPPYEFVIGTSDESTVTGLTGFVPAASMLVRYGNDTSLAQLDPMADMNGSYYIGMLKDFKIRVVRGIPQYYGFGWKSYGPNSRRNPLRIRLNKGQSRPTAIAMPDPNAGMGIIPLQNMMTQIGFGVGVADRTNGTARYTNNTTWADGTPT